MKHIGKYLTKQNYTTIMTSRYMVTILNTLYFSLLILKTISARLPNDDVAIIRQRVLELMIWQQMTTYQTP
jgi:hypothetical protein